MRRADILRAVYALCLLGGTSTHLLTVLRHGLFWDYGGVPQASAVFWTSLTLIDPLVILLLFVRRDLGIAATIALMIADVTHNLWIVRQVSPPLLEGIARSWPLQCQIAFLIFVLATAPLARGRKSSGEDHADTPNIVVLIARGRSGRSGSSSACRGKRR